MSWRADFLSALQFVNSRVQEMFLLAELSVSSLLHWTVKMASYGRVSSVERYIRAR